MRLLKALFLGVALLGSAAGLLADAPTVEPVPDVSVETRTEIKFAVTAKSEDAPLRYAIGKVRKDGQETPTPKGMTLDADKGAFTWLPTPSQAGVYELTVNVKDAKNQESSTAVKMAVKPRGIAIGGGAVGDLLRKWHTEGSAAGNTGDFYDNRDGEHSPLNLDPWPQLDKVPYTPEERKRRVDWAAQHTVLKHVTFGNSSTSAPPQTGGSNVRSYYAHPRGMEFLYSQYRASNVYIYPEHRDHDPGHNGRGDGYGDLYPANSPYLFTSQGSSGSDQPFMRATPYALAAFRPEVKKKLIEAGLLMPTLQMIVRSTNKHLKDPKEYLTGKAHPTVFENTWVNDLEMVKLAHDIQATNIPPMIQLKVAEEDVTVPGRDSFEGNPLAEKLHDTPASIARIVRGPNHVRRMVVSAEGSFDVNKKALTYHWSVLRGDAKRITIKPMNEAGSIVEILVPYHDRYTIDSPVKIETNRVDIGAFVSNGTYYSAPGFVTLYSLDCEARTYDAKGRLLEIGHGVGDADFNIGDWNALFEVLQAEPKTLAAQLLQKPFNEEQLAALRKAGEEYRNGLITQKAAQERSKKLGDERQKGLAEFKKVEDAAKAAKKLLDADPTEKHKADYQAAKADLDAALSRREIAEERFKEAQQVTDEANKVVNDLLNAKRPGLDQPIRPLLENTLAKVRDNVNFLGEHRAALDALLQAADEPHKARVLAARKRLVQLRVLKAEGDAFVPHALREGNAPVAERLTAYERNMLERYHAELLSALVYPKFLSIAFKVNFVDQRITTPKTWRDVYHHDAKGTPIGWTRYDGENVSDFTADGHLVLEKDAKGRALKARAVKYEFDPMALKTNQRVVRATPDAKVFTYEYADDNDLRGKIAKEEAVEEKK
ncbi:MAG: putative Ig domain-containing protein [Gemmataceae bacterium]|nr:putative Ig domain-containing protein [Gemmataceae bacterium]